MKEIQIYEPAMCCSTGVCGPSIDPELLRVSFIVSNLEKREYPIGRYNLSSAPNAFIENATVNEALNKQGVEVLPFILVDNEMILTGRYPTNEEFEKWTGIPSEELTKKPKIKLSLKTKGGNL